MAQILDLDESHLPLYLCCLEPWSEEMQDAGDHKSRWYEQMRDKGLRVKLACEGDDTVGMIQYLPVEKSDVEGQGLYFIYCIWVHGHKQGVGNWQRRGIGTALLKAAEEDARALGAKGMTAWGLILPFWMRAAWFRKHGYKPVDRNGIAQLVWKPFTPDAVPPRWIRPRKRPELSADRVTVTGLVDGWCPAMNISFERAKRAAEAFGEQVRFEQISTLDRDTFVEWGRSNSIFIDGRQVNTGPPPTYEKLHKLIERQVRRRR